VTEDERRNSFATGFARQARSDWQVFQLLQAERGVPTCHSLHYLQMACEKIAKAYRLRDTDSPIDTLLSRHVGSPKFVSALVKSPRVLKRYAGKSAQLQTFERQASVIARTIETLAPSVDRGSQPENTEYPWESDEVVRTPCEYSFPNLSLLWEPSGRAFLKLVAEALHDFDEVS